MIHNSKNEILKRKEVASSSININSFGHITASANRINIQGDYYYNHILISEVKISGYVNIRNLKKIFAEMVIACNQSNRICEYICIDRSRSECPLSQRQLLTIGFSDSTAWALEDYNSDTWTWRKHV